MDDIVQRKRRYRDELGRTEALPPAAFARYREQQLTRLIEFARNNVPYYRKRLAPLFVAGKFDAAAWHEVPVLTRAAINGKYAELQARVLPDFVGPLRAGVTSGSTGVPLRYRVAEIQDVASAALTERSFDWWKLESGRTMGALHYFPPNWPEPIGVAIRGWRNGTPVGSSYLLQLDQPMAVQLDWLQHNGIEYLKTRPAAAEALAEENLRRGLGIRLRAILPVGGPVSQNCRAVCRESFGAEIYDTYGSSECGHIAAECPDCRLMHVDAEAHLVEVVKEDLMPCAPGETGRVLITSFFSYAMPLIRYDLGDYAELGPAQALCGRPYPSLARIMGRDSEMFVRRDGSRFFPVVQGRSLLDVMAFDQVQFVQTDYEVLEIRYVPAPGNPTLDRAAVENYVRERLGEEFAVRLVPLDAIPHTPGAKYLYQRCEVKPPAPSRRGGSLALT